MPAYVPLYQEVFQQITTVAKGSHIRITSLRRLALLVTGILAAKTTGIAQIAHELLALGLTNASCQESIERGLRRTLNDPSLTPQTCYQPILHQVIPWQASLQGNKRIFLSVDESSKEDQVHLFRLSLSYRGGSLPLVWAIWQQNQPLEEGQYWAIVEEVFVQVAALLPKGLEVIILADRAYDVPPFLDLVRAYGWHFIIRCKAKGSLWFRDRLGREGPLARLIRQRVPAPGRRWKGQGWAYKKAGWRRVSVVAVWAAREEEPLVVLTDLAPRWEVIAWYGRRFWIEPGFRNDKTKGWRWEESRVREVEHNQRLLLAMAWASLVALCLGVQEAEARRAKLAQRKARQKKGRMAKPQPARESIFTMGLRRLRGWLYGTTKEAIRWLLPELEAVSWTCQWYHHQSLLYIFKTVRL